MNYYFILFIEILSVLFLFYVLHIYEKKYFDIIMKDYKKLEEKLIPCIFNPIIFQNNVSDEEYEQLKDIFIKYKKIEKLIFVIVSLSLIINSLFVKCSLF